VFYILCGAAVGMLAWYAIADTLRGAVSTGSIWAMAVAALAGAVVGALSERALGLTTIGIGTILALVSLTPLTQWAVGRAAQADPLRHADAIVALDGGRGPTGVPSAATHSRFMNALALYEEGWAPSLVVSIGRSKPGVTREHTVKMQLGPFANQKDVVLLPPGENTHDEATETAKLAEQHGWHTIILVTDPLHLRRAAATFTKVGLEVVGAPCGTPEYDIERLNNVPARIRALSDWLHEVIGFQVYKRRGWV
jgi:uncharacterized SAM-binding protein YcdF (DUF218 family)